MREKTVGNQITKKQKIVKEIVSWVVCNCSYISFTNKIFCVNTNSSKAKVNVSYIRRKSKINFK